MIWLALLSAFALASPDLRAPPPARTALATDAQGYRFTADFLPHLEQLAAERPGLVRLESIGESVRRQPILAVHVAEPGVPVDRRVLVFAGIHALEWISTETALALIDELVAAPPRGVAVTVIPVLNPDGRARVEADLNEGARVYRRGNHRNVDLNRDFAAQREPRALWRHVIPAYYAVSDEQPLSQPESRALDALCAREGYDRAASLHAFGGYLYHPWAGAWRHPPDQDAFVALGRRMEAAQGGHAYRTRQLARWGFFFRAHGTELDHLYAEHGIQAWLFELTRSGIDPAHPLQGLKTPFRWYNPSRPEPHVARGVAALRELIRADDAD